MPQTLTTMSAADLRPFPGNPRRGDIDAIRESIRKNGFFGALVVRSGTNEILAGNHRFRAGVAEGLTSFPVHVVDVDDAGARRILLADNKTGDRATYDTEALADILRSVAEGIDELNASVFAGTGYSLPEVDALLAGALTGTPPEEEAATPGQQAAAEWNNAGAPEYAHEDQDAYRKMLMNFKTKEDFEAFMTLIGQTCSDRTRFLWFPKAEIGHVMHTRVVAANPEGTKK